MKFKDLIGQRFGKWVVLKRALNDKNNHIKWLCRCECGTEKAVLGQHLIGGQSTNCHRCFIEINKIKAKQRTKQHYKDNRERLLKKTKQYDDDHQEKIKEYKQKYYQDNKIKLNEDNRKWIKNKRKTDIKFNLVSKIRFAIWKTLKGNKNGWHWEDLIGYTLNDLIKRLKQTMPEGYTWDDYMQGKLHIDHIVPIRAFTFKTPQDKEFRWCWDLCNLRLLTSKKNISKKDNLDKPILLGLLIKEQRQY